MQESAKRCALGCVNIIDGSGVYVTRNENYEYGRFEMSYNRAYSNGINGLVVHKTDRAREAIQ